MRAWRRELCLQNPKSTGITDRRDQLRASQIRPHRRSNDWMLYAEEFAQRRSQHWCDQCGCPIPLLTTTLSKRFAECARAFVASTSRLRGAHSYQRFEEIMCDVRDIIYRAIECVLHLRVKAW